MATPWGLTCLFIGLNILQNCVAHPMENLLSGSEGPNGQVMGVLVAVMVSVCFVFVLLACVCCKRRSGFKENENEKKVFRNSPVSASVINETSLSGDDPGHVNPIANAEFTIFTPLSPPHHNNNVFRSQPSVICYTENEAAPELYKAVNPQIDGIDVSDWFADTEYDFPRSRLKYIRELGTGWFGRVIEGEAHGIDPPSNNPTWAPVAVRILESSAPASEQAQFLHEAAVYRAGAHPNLLRLLGRSLEATPLLLIQEFCPRGDLKKFLLENKECKDSEVMAGVPLTFCCQLAAAVQFLHERNLPHIDLAARTCQITSDLNLKLGDYGLAVTQYPNDYYQGTPSIPVRWCAPESVNHTNTTLQPKQVTLEANIWSLAVTFWEICEWGRLPYDWLSDDEVVSQVMDGHTRLSQPTLNAYYIPPLYRLMEYCWLPDQNRPQINQIYSMLDDLTKTYTSSPSTQPEINDFSTETFDLRWESFKPNTIIKTDNAKTKSASLTNLHGSFENLADEANDTIIQMDSWLENVASHTGDMQYVRGLSEAIHELDTALASEQTSSSSSFEPTPNSSLGPARSDTVLHMDDSNLDSLIFVKRSESGSETEDETWRKRIERGAYSEKVKQKSKSVADLMILTHIDLNTVKDIFQDDIKKLHEERRGSLLFVPVQPDVNINQSDKIAERSFELPGTSSLIIPELMDHLKSSTSEECFVQADKLLRKTEVSSSHKKESQIENSEQKNANKLLKSPESSLVVERITDNKPNSETVSTVYDSKLEKTKINLVESNQIANKITNQETSNFDTFLQEPVINKIETIETKNKNLEIIDNQHIVSKEILDKLQISTLISTSDKNIDKEETNSQNTGNNINEADLSQKPDNLEQNDKKVEHIEPISFKTYDLSSIQDFIIHERYDTSLTTNKIVKPVENSLQKEVINKNYEPDAIITSQKETSTINSDLELESNKLQPNEKKIENLKLEETQVNELLAENKDSHICEKANISIKSADNLKEKQTDSSPQIDVICVQNIDLNISNNKLVPQTEDVIKPDDDKQTTEKSSSITEILEDNIVESQIKEVAITKTDNILIGEEVTYNTSVDIEIMEPKTASSLIPELQSTEKMQERNEIKLNIVSEVKEIPITDKKLIGEEVTTDTNVDIELKETKTVSSLIPELQSIENIQEMNETKLNILPEVKEGKEVINETNFDMELKVKKTVPILFPELQLTEKMQEMNENKLNIVSEVKESSITDNKLIGEEVTNNTNVDIELKKRKTISSLIPELQSTEKMQEMNETKLNIVSEVKETSITDNKLIGEEVINDTNVDIELKKPKTISSLIPELQTTEKMHENLLEINKTELEIVSEETSEENLVDSDDDPDMPQLIFVDSIENKLQTNDQLVGDLLQNVSNNLIKIPPPPQFVESSKENNEITDLAQKEEMTDVKSTTDNVDILVQLDEIRIENVENQPIMETLESQSNEAVHIKLETNDNLNEGEITNIQTNTLEIQEIVETPTKEINSDAMLLQKEIIPDIKINEVPHFQLDAKLIDESTNSPQHKEIETKQIDPMKIVKSEEFSVIQNFINNERNNNHDLILSQIKPKAFQKLNEDCNSSLPLVSFNLASDLVDISNVQQINQVVKNERKIQQNLIPIDVASPEEVIQKSNEENLKLPPVLSELTSDLLDSSNNQQISQEDLIPSEVSSAVEVNQNSSEENANLPVISSDLTSNLLDTSNVQQINQVFNVFNVTVDHKPPLECFTSPVKNFYARTFDQNEIITDINTLLVSERKKYENKNSVCTSSLQNDFLPFVNGISSELSDKIIDILNEKEENIDNEPKKLSEIAFDSLKNIPEYSELSEEKITNGHDELKELSNTIRERPKKLSELVLDSLKTNSMSEDSGIVSLKCEENGIKDAEGSSEDLLKISTDSLDDILSNTEENIEDRYENEIILEIRKVAEDVVNEIIEEATKKLSEKLNNNITHCKKLFTSFGEQEEIECTKNFEQKPKKLSEIVQDSLNKTYVQDDVSSYLPDIVLDNLQNRTFVKDQNITDKDQILINLINDSPLKSLNSLSENSESAIEDVSDKNILNIDSPSKLSEIILDSLPCNSPVTSESTDNVSDKTVIEVKNSDGNNQICDEHDKSEVENFEPNFLPTSTPFKSNVMPKKTESNDSFFSFVSEGDEPSDCQTHVILGPCEEYGLGLYSGLKTTFGKFSDDDRPEEEILQFSSNFMPYSDSETTHNSVDYSLETWDKFLGKSLQDQDNCPSSVFDNFSPREDTLDVFNGKNKNEVEINNGDLNKTVTITNNKNDTFTIENAVPVAEIKMKEDDSDQPETTQSSWEPGEGWFLHPQTGADDLTGQIDISGGDNVDNSYVGFALDEECVNALRNELAAKLPHAQGLSHEEPQEPEEWDSEERNEIIVKYNVYATPLSPIPEESCCDDVYCDQVQHRDGSDSESEWSEPCLGQTSQLEEDILVVDTETHTALILESPSLREPQHRHTPSQDSCCSNDTLFNLEDLNYGHSPQHQGLTTAQTVDSEQIIEIEITENETPKQSPTIPKIETENSNSSEMNLTYTKPDINIESENSNHQTVQEEESSKSKLELKLDPNAFGVAPLPSPEDIPWRQLPASMLTYNEVVQNDKFEIQDSEDGATIEIVDQEDLNLAAENTNDDLSDSVRDCTADVDLYSNLTDIRFSGPCDAQLMSTSFSESAEYAEERDWDSGSDTRSSSSGEFIWKEGEHEESLRALHAASHDVGVTEDINPMDAIDEEISHSSEDSDDCEEDMEETEFVPSAWDAQATPTKSALRSPEKSTIRKTPQKGVWFKKQKYHCVYEYPREPESPVAAPSDLWRPLSDISTFADWELDPESCIPATFEDTTDGPYDVLDKFITRSNYPLTSGNARHRDLYQLNPFPEFGAGLSSSEEDFFISSSARPFQAVGQSSQFFPGQNNPPKSKFLWQDYQSSSQQSSRDLSEGITPDSGIDDVTPASISESGLVDILPSRSQKVPPLKCLAAIAANKTPPAEQKNVDSSLGGLRHTRNRLKLDLPPSPNSFSSTRTFSIDISNDPVINREIPTFTTFGKSRFSVQHVTTPTDEYADPLQLGKPKIKNVSFEALPHKPMKLTETVYILDKSEDDGKKPVEMVQGEASLLDSADEDSGIESSANATLERHQQQILN